MNQDQNFRSTTASDAYKMQAEELKVTIKTLQDEKKVEINNESHENSILVKTVEQKTSVEQVTEVSLADSGTNELIKTIELVDVEDQDLIVEVINQDNCDDSLTSNLNDNGWIPSAETGDTNGEDWTLPIDYYNDTDPNLFT